MVFPWFSHGFTTGQLADRFNEPLGSPGRRGEGRHRDLRAVFTKNGTHGMRKKKRYHYTSIYIMCIYIYMLYIYIYMLYMYMYIYIYIFCFTRFDWDSMTFHGDSIGIVGYSVKKKQPTTV